MPTHNALLSFYVRLLEPGGYNLSVCDSCEKIFWFILTVILIKLPLCTFLDASWLEYKFKKRVSQDFK